MDYHESLPSFDTFQYQTNAEASPFASTAQDRPHATMLGVGKPDLPPPPAGMPYPPTALTPAAVKSTSLAAGVQSTDHFDPAAYNAIAKLSREIIERIVWEVVPDLAERIIREELDRLVEKRRSG